MMSIVLAAVAFFGFAAADNLAVFTKANCTGAPAGLTQDFALPLNFSLCASTTTLPLNISTLLPNVTVTGKFAMISLQNGTLSWGVNCTTDKCDDCEVKTILPRGQCKEVKGLKGENSVIYMVYNQTAANTTTTPAPTSTAVNTATTTGPSSAGSQARPASFITYAVVAATLVISALVF